MNIYQIGSGIAGVAVLASIALGDGHDRQHVSETPYTGGHHWNQGPLALGTASVANYGTVPLSSVD